MALVAETKVRRWRGDGKGVRDPILDRAVVAHVTRGHGGHTRCPRRGCHRMAGLTSGEQAFVLRVIENVLCRCPRCDRTPAQDGNGHGAANHRDPRGGMRRTAGGNLVDAIELLRKAESPTRIRS